MLKNHWIPRTSKLYNKGFGNNSIWSLKKEEWKIQTSKIKQNPMEGKKQLNLLQWNKKGIETFLKSSLEILDKVKWYDWKWNNGGNLPATRTHHLLLRDKGLWKSRVIYGKGFFSVWYVVLKTLWLGVQIRSKYICELELSLCTLSRLIIWFKMKFQLEFAALETKANFFFFNLIRGLKKTLWLGVQFRSKYIWALEFIKWPASQSDKK